SSRERCEHDRRRRASWHRPGDAARPRAGDPAEAGGALAPGGRRGRSAARSHHHRIAVAGAVPRTGERAGLDPDTPMGGRISRAKRLPSLFMATLLVADDLVPIRQMVRITLSTQGWTILEAKNGAEALEIARANKPDLILLDVDMGPGPNGFEVCKTIKADAKTKDIPVVML